RRRASSSIRFLSIQAVRGEHSELHWRGAGDEVKLAAVDDVANTLEGWTIDFGHHSHSTAFDTGHHKGRPSEKHLAHLDAQEILLATANTGRPDAPSQLAANQGTAPSSSSASGRFLAALSNGANINPIATLTAARPASIWAAHKASIDRLFADAKL